MIHCKFTERLIPREKFNPASKKHLQAYWEYLRWGKWEGNCPFKLEWPYNDIPTMISAKILQAHINNIIGSVKDK